MSNIELRSTRTGQLDPYGCEILKLSRYRDGKDAGSCLVVSGAPGRQNFRRANDPSAYAGSLEPIPEGRYAVGAVQWAGKPGDWTVSFGPGIGPFLAALVPLQPLTGGRDAFLLHLDANRLLGAPGTAGCEGFIDTFNAQIYLDWRIPAGTVLTADHGLGSVPALGAEVKPTKPEPKEEEDEPDTSVLKRFRKPERAIALYGPAGKAVDLPQGELLIAWDYTGKVPTERWELNGRELPKDTLDLVLRHRGEPVDLNAPAPEEAGPAAKMAAILREKAAAEAARDGQPIAIEPPPAEDYKPDPRD